MIDRTPPLAPSRGAHLLVLTVALLFPSLLTWTYFVFLADADTSIQRAVYVSGKAAQFLLPALFVLAVTRHRVRLPWRVRSGRVEGVVSGLVVAGATVALWRVLERADSPLLVELSANAGAKLAGLGIVFPTGYLALSLFYSFVHSFLEEYYWRWFVFGGLRRILGLLPSIAISSIGFSLHHIIIVATFAGWDSPWTLLFALLLIAGGAYWASLFERTGSLTPVWISHLLADMAIFGVGYALSG